MKKRSNLDLAEYACFGAATFVSKTDNSLNDASVIRLCDSFKAGYSEEYKKIMNIGEGYLKNRLIDEDILENGFLNFIRDNDEIAHTAYVKVNNQIKGFYHANGHMKLM